MEWSKLKNIIILLLVITDLFLLASVLAFRGGGRGAEESALRDVCALLEEQGISVDPETLPRDRALLPLTAQRDREAESALAAALLGECQITDRGGGLYVHTAAAGSATFRSGGEVTVSFSGGGLEAAGDLEAHGAEILERMGVEAHLLTALAGGEATVLTARQVWEDLPLFNCQLELRYEGGRLVSISGRLLLGAAEEDPSAGAALPVATALTRFLAAITDSGDVCRSITAMAAGYLHAATFTDPVRLTPVWLISTDTASYYLDAATGALTRLS